MRPRAKALTLQPDRRFLFWILIGLVAGMMSTGVMAVTTALTMTNLP
jgi:preprotein translocase subunit SecF